MGIEVLNAKKVYNTGFNAGLMPEPNIGICKWSDIYRYLPRKGSSEPGRYDSSRTPYVREIMDCIDNGSPYENVYVMKGTQMGMTELGNNWFGKNVHISPGPMLMVFIDQDTAEIHSKTKLQPGINATPVLKKRISENGIKDSSNTILYKEFLGGWAALGWAGSSKTGRHKSVRYLYIDDVDGMVLDVNGEGHPADVNITRTDSYGAKKKIYINGSPTTKDVSYIYRCFLDSDQRYYHIPCPFCNWFQTLSWDKLKFKHKDYSLTTAVKCKCEKCEKLFEEKYKTQFLADGIWEKKNEGHINAGFFLPSFYSPLGWLPWKQIAREFLQATKQLKKFKDNKKLIQVTNTRFAQPWEEKGEYTMDEDKIYARREQYGPVVPIAAGVLTGSVDVHDNRFEIIVDAWGKGQERWNMAYQIIIGDPEKQEIWDKLDKYLLKNWTHESGAILKIACVGIDQGHKSKEVNAFVWGRRERGVFAYKGKGGYRVPFISNASLKKQFKKEVKPIMVGTDTTKDSIYKRLTLKEYGPGYHHFPMERDREFFKGLAGEVRKIKYVNQLPVPYYDREHTRNEPIDLCVMSMSALSVYLGSDPNPSLDTIVDLLQEKKQEVVIAPKKRYRELHPGYE